MTEKDPHYMSYWEIRKAIRDAVLKDDQERMEILKTLYPDTFRNVSQQAMNDMKRREEG